MSAPGVTFGINYDPRINGQIQPADDDEADAAAAAAIDVNRPPARRIAAGRPAARARIGAAVNVPNQPRGDDADNQVNREEIEMVEEQKQEVERNNPLE